MTDDLMYGGENGLYFVTVNVTQEAAGAGAGGTAVGAAAGTASLQLRLCNMGQVQQQGARLVTGQTPTVSVADFDGDGRAGHSCWDK